MNTLKLNSQQVDLAAEILKKGGLIGIPTETVYGLGANGLDKQAVANIFVAKGRPQDNPLILHVPDVSWLERFCQNVPESAYQLAKNFWPGPLTMVLERTSLVPNVVTANLDTVGIRCPDHDICREIIVRADVPVAAPSGNRSGRPSPTSAKDMLEDMDGTIEAVLDGGNCQVGVESTIIDLTIEPPRLLRPGGITLEQLRDVLGQVEVDGAVMGVMKEGEQPRAPGMKYRHYAPVAPVTVVRGDYKETARYIAEQACETDGIICFDECSQLFSQKYVKLLGEYHNKNEQARRVFEALRGFDQTDVGSIWAQCPDDSDIGLAIANRLSKAAGFHVIRL